RTSSSCARRATRRRRTTTSRLTTGRAAGPPSRSGKSRSARLLGADAPWNEADGCGVLVDHRLGRAPNALPDHAPVLLRIGVEQARRRRVEDLGIGVDRDDVTAGAVSVEMKAHLAVRRDVSELGRLALALDVDRVVTGDDP